METGGQACIKRNKENRRFHIKEPTVTFEAISIISLVWKALPHVSIVMPLVPFDLKDLVQCWTRSSILASLTEWKLKS